jgi:hypothetical protein
MLANQQGLLPDMSHVIRQLTFGSEDKRQVRRVMYDFSSATVHVLENKKFENLVEQLGRVHGVVHELSVVPSKFVYPNGQSSEIFQYSATSNVISGRSLAVTFNLNIENVIMI